MITGSVASNLSPTIPLTLLGTDLREVTIEVEVDTGFTGGLTLPADLIRSLGWPFQINEYVILADGRAHQMDLYSGLILWKGGHRIFGVYESNSKASLGLEILEGNDLWIQVKRGGIVVISEMTPESLPESPRSVKPLIGLVGGMGSGKSLVAEAFASHGGSVISADVFGHAALAQPEILARIAERWQDRVLDEHGKVDRNKMGAIVFASPVERANLELLVFPWIEQRIRAAVAKAQAEPSVRFVVLDAAIMLEANWNKICDHIVYVHAHREMRLARLSAQRGWTPEGLSQRESAQMPLALKASRAGTAIDNSGTVEKTRKQVDVLLRSWHIL